MRAEPHNPLVKHYSTSFTADVVEAGALAGLLGGVAMALFATTYAAIAGIGATSPVTALTATVSRTDALPGASVVVVGCAIHLFVSIVFGVIFAYVTPKEVPLAPALAIGAFAGVTILVMMTWIVLPVVNPAARAHLMWGSAPGTIPVAAAFVMHVVYGAGLGLAPSLRRRFQSRAATARR